MILALIAFPTLGLLAAIALAVLTPGEPGRYLLPAARTVAGMTALVVITAVLWSHP